tara:strand:- start:246 stop:464 length:219 start_codon:yes stop_codon:yes gene_type:complete
MSFKRTQFHPETDPGSLRFHDYWFKVKSNGTIEFDGDISAEQLKCQMGDLFVVIEDEGVVKFVPTHLVPDKY